MIDAGIIIIGNEILSGRTIDTNSNFICKHCEGMGIKVKEIIIIPDYKKRIIKIVKKFSKEYNHVFVTGGIGPTHDDITAEAIATAFKRELRLNLKAKRLLKNYYSKSNIELNESRMKMAFIPKRASLISNPVSAAPGFRVNNVWVMAGVPKIMQAMFNSDVKSKIKKEKNIYSEDLIIFKAEGDVAKILKSVQKNYLKIEIGSYPFMLPPKFGTNIVFKGTNFNMIKQAIKELIQILKKNKIEYSKKK